MIVHPLRKLAGACAVSTLLTFVTGVVPGAVRAAAAEEQPSEEALAQAKAAFTTGQEKYNAGDKKGAIADFKEAYRLSKNPLLLYNVGFVLDEVNDKALALHYYKKFVAEAPKNKKTKANRILASERIAVLQEEIADGNVGTPLSDTIATDPKTTDPKATDPKTTDPKATDPATTEPVAADPTEFRHEIVEEAPPGKPIDVTATVPKGSGWRVTLYFRGPGQEDFSRVKLEPRLAELVGRIPAAMVTGSSIQYYLDVLDASGEPVATSGSPTSPNIIFVDEAARAHYYDDFGGTAAGVEVRAATGATSGPRDQGSRTLTYAKWATTGGAVALVTSSIVFYISAGRYSDALEEEARLAQERCTVQPAPCREFSGVQRDLERTGKSYETWATVTMGVGAAAAIGAGVLWYLDLRAPRSKSTEPRITGAPFVTPYGIGGAAIIRF